MLNGRSMVVCVLVASGCGSPPPPRPTGSPAPVAPSSMPRATSVPVSAAPTVLDAAARQRDAARVPLATAIVDAYPNWNGMFSSLVATWSPDGKSLVFGSQRDGLPEIYVADAAHPDAPARALTSGPERALDAQVTWDGK